MFSTLTLLTLMCVTNSQTPDPLAKTIQPFVDRHSLSGAVMLVADKDRVLDTVTVGYADIEANQPMKPEDLFWIASESKPITVTALMMLVDEGKVHLDDPVSKFLPEFKDLWVKVTEADGQLTLKRPQHEITVREICSHTSGLRFASSVERPTLDLLPLRYAVMSYALTPLETEPGTHYAYANAGINTAGRIIEVVSGMPYEKFLSERLFKPLGMKDTTFRPTRAQIERLAKSYKPNPDKTNLVETPITQLKYPLDSPDRYPFPAGGLFSTADDLRRFAQMILSGGTYHGKRFVTEKSVKEMTRKQTGDDIETNYGLGWSAGEVFGHGGAYSTDLSIDSKHNLILIWMVQQEGYANDGSQSLGEFHRVARATFGAK